MSGLLKQYKDAQSGGNSVPLHFLYTGNKLANVKHAVSQGVNQFGNTAQAQVTQLQHTAVALGQQSAQAQLGTFAPAHTIKTPAPAATTKLVGTSQGKPLSNIMSGFGEEAADRCGKALIAGVSIGQEPDTISKLIMAALLVSLYRSLTIDRTAMMESYRMSLLITLQQNEDLTSGWIWRAFPGACAFCQSMDGTKHDLSETMDSHPNCRCVQELIAA
jgi:hypothetical protein